MANSFSLSQSMAIDPQMQVPKKPKISEDVLRISCQENVMLFLGGPTEIVFRGKAVSKVFPSLIPQLNGRNTVDQIKNNLGYIPGRVIDEAISLLFIKGVMEEGDLSGINLTREQVTKYSRELMFYSRYVDLTRTKKSRYEVLKSLQDSKIVLLTDSLKASSLSEILAQLGVGNVTIFSSNPAVLEDPMLVSLKSPTFDLSLQSVVFDNEGIREVESTVAQASLTVALFDNISTETLAKFNRVYRAQGRKFLFTCISSARVQIGPMFESVTSSCLECAEISGHLLVPESLREFSDVEINIAINRLSNHILSIVTKFIPIFISNSMEYLDSNSLEFKHVAVYRQLVCPSCNGWYDETAIAQDGINIPTGAGVCAPLSWFYHDNTNHQSSQMVPKGHQAHYSQGNMDTVSGAYKTVKNRQVFQLDNVNILPESFSQSYSLYSAHMTAQPIFESSVLKRIGDLLMLCCGRQVEEVVESWNVGFRITPSAGSMASQTLYFFNFSIPDITRGVYHFNPNGAFEHISAMPELSVQAFSNLLVSQQPLPEKIVGAIVINEAFDRVESKYKNTAYRYTSFDGGAMLMSIYTIAPLLGFEVYHVCNFFDDELSQFIETGIISEFTSSICLLVDTKGGK